MESLLIINSDKKINSEKIMDFLMHNYQITTADTPEEAIVVVGERFFDLYLVVANEINQPLIDLFKKIRLNRSDLLPLIISLPIIDDHSQALAFRQRIPYMIHYPIDLDQLKKEFDRVSKIMTTLNEKIVTISTRKYIQEYPVKQIIYFERNRPRYLKIVTLENNNMVESEFFFKYAIEEFVNKHGINRYFAQIHQSYLVNLNFIKKIDDANLEVTLMDGKKLPLGLTYYKSNKSIQKNKRRHKRK